jgi:hypothetical protein
MKRLGTDVRALAAIGVGAAISVVATLAFTAAPEASRAATADCVVEVRHSAPNVVVALSSGYEAVVVAPDLHFESMHDCTNSVEMIDGVRIQEIKVGVAQDVQARVREALQQAREGRQRGREGRERSLEARVRARVELERARERIDQARTRVEGIGDFDFDFDFDFDLDELEFALDETFVIELEQRLEDAMERVEVRLGDQVGT